MRRLFNRKVPACCWRSRTAGTARVAVAQAKEERRSSGTGHTDVGGVMDWAASVRPVRRSAAGSDTRSSRFRPWEWNAGIQAAFD
jgi:hypothetical protein